MPCKYVCVVLFNMGSSVILVALFNLPNSPSADSLQCPVFVPWFIGCVHSFHCVSTAIPYDFLSMSVLCGLSIQFAWQWACAIDVCLWFPPMPMSPNPFSRWSVDRAQGFGLCTQFVREELALPVVQDDNPFYLMFNTSGAMVNAQHFQKELTWGQSNRN